MILPMKRMKTKTYMIIFSLISLSTILIWLFNSPTPHLRTFMSKTQLHIQNINSKLQVLDESKKDLDVESTYLEMLGFIDNPKLYNDNQSINYNRELTFVTAFTHFTDKEKLLIESKLKFFPNYPILIYDIDLTFSEQLKIQKLCKDSCHLKTFKGEKYPKHLMQSKLKAYKPIIIQEVLNEYGQLIWIQPPNVLISNKIDDYLNKSKSQGLVVWPSKEPITQMTHPSMFKYFTLKPQDFYFVHMLDTTLMIIVNKEQIHKNLMLPWVKCALKEDCISPPGAQLYGCDFTRRPQFLYSGCHRYESSSFSIITALLFNFDSTKYTPEQNQPLFSLSLTLLEVTTNDFTTFSIGQNNENNNNNNNNNNNLNKRIRRKKS